MRNNHSRTKYGLQPLNPTISTGCSKNVVKN
nr:MAG TPA: hypothetical protein [Caudoviricetes sp.]